MRTNSVRFSSLALIAANLIPLVGVLVYGWSATLVLALFWIENLVIGAFNLLKMLIVVLRSKNFGGLFTCGFFVLHYGFFCAVHGLILWDILDLGELNSERYFPNLEPGFIESFADGAVVFLSFLEMFGPIGILGVFALALSNLVSFIENFILKGEIFKQTVKGLMGKPYPRIMILHVGLILGALALEKLGSPVWLLAVIVVIKIVADIKLHNERRKKSVALPADSGK